MGRVPVACVSSTLSLSNDMYQLRDLALEAILREWDIQEYDPPNTDIREWMHATESLCDEYGIPDTQRPRCATKFIKDELRAGLENVLREARAQFGPIHWAQFNDFMVGFDRKRDSIVIKPLLTKIPQEISERHGRVSASFLVVRQSVLTRALNRTPVLQKIPKTHRSRPRDHRRCPVGPSRYRWCPQCCGVHLRRCSCR